MAALVYAIPVFILPMLVQLAVSVKRRRAAYRLNDAVNSLSLGIRSRVSGVFLTGLGLLIYILVISWMAAQAIGRAPALGGSAPLMVAVGAVALVLSDSLLAIEKFALPSEANGLAVPLTSDLAQGLIFFILLPREASR